MPAGLQRGRPALSSPLPREGGRAPPPARRVGVASGGVASSGGAEPGERAGGQEPRPQATCAAEPAVAEPSGGGGGASAAATAAAAAAEVGRRPVGVEDLRPSTTPTPGSTDHAPFPHRFPGPQPRPSPAPQPPDSRAGVGAGVGGEQPPAQGMAWGAMHPQTTPRIPQPAAELRGPPATGIQRQSPHFLLRSQPDGGRIHSLQHQHQHQQHQHQHQQHQHQHQQHQHQHQQHQHQQHQHQQHQQHREGELLVAPPAGSSLKGYMPSRPAERRLGPRAEVLLERPPPQQAEPMAPPGGHGSQTFASDLSRAISLEQRGSTVSMPGLVGGAGEGVGLVSLPPGHDLRSAWNKLFGAQDSQQQQKQQHQEHQLQQGRQRCTPPPPPSRPSASAALHHAPATCSPAQTCPPSASPRSLAWQTAPPTAPLLPPQRQGPSPKPAMSPLPMASCHPGASSQEHRHATDSPQRASPMGQSSSTQGRLSGSTSSSYSGQNVTFSTFKPEDDDDDDDEEADREVQDVGALGPGAKYPNKTGSRAASSRGTPMLLRDTPLSNRQTPLSHRDTPLSHRGTPVSTRETPSNVRHLRESLNGEVNSYGNDPDAAWKELTAAKFNPMHTRRLPDRDRARDGDRDGDGDRDINGDGDRDGDGDGDGDRDGDRDVDGDRDEEDAAEPGQSPRCGGRPGRQAAGWRGGWSWRGGRGGSGGRAVGPYVNPAFQDSEDEEGQQQQQQQDIREQQLNGQDSIFDYYPASSEEPSSPRSVTPPLPPISPPQTPQGSVPSSPELGAPSPLRGLLLPRPAKPPPGGATRRQQAGVASLESPAGGTRHCGERPPAASASLSGSTWTWQTKPPLLMGVGRGHHSSLGRATLAETASESNLSFDVDTTTLLVEPSDVDTADSAPLQRPLVSLLQATPPQATPPASLETAHLHRQLARLEALYVEVLEKLGADQDLPGPLDEWGQQGQQQQGQQQQQQQQRQQQQQQQQQQGGGAPPLQRRWSLASSDTNSLQRRRLPPLSSSSSRAAPPARELKAMQRRLQRVESHVVTLARSVAHLTSELRSHSALLQQAEALRREVRDLRLQQQQQQQQQQGRGPHLPLNHSSEFERFRGWIPSLTNPRRINKLTKFFGTEPPLLQMFLKKLGYERYAHNFESEHIGMVELPYLTEARLQEIGLPLGPRLRILQEAQLCFRQENFDIYIV